MKCVQITHDTEFVLLACDGIWDVMSSQQGVDFIHKECYGGNYALNAKKRSLNDLVKGCEAMMEECCAKDISMSQGLGCDNMTAILVELRPKT